MLFRSSTMLKRKHDEVIEKPPIRNPDVALISAPSYTAVTSSYPSSYPPNVPQISVPVTVYAPATTVVKPAPNLNASGKPKAFFRKAAGQAWEDPTLADWNPDDFRIFVGDLGNEVNDELLKNSFNKYPTFQKAKVIRDKRTTKSKGYGFVSFSNAKDYVAALKEMNGKYIGNRPCKLRKSRWQDFNDTERIEAAKQAAKKKKKGPSSKKRKPNSVNL